MPVSKSRSSRLSGWRKKRVLGSIEPLEVRAVMDASFVISEFMASNDDALLDEDGDDSDWIEVLNSGTEIADLAGWHLTDDPGAPNKWEFPSVVLAPGQYAVVFASGKDRDVAGSELHTNFSLATETGYLALTRPNQTVASEYNQYPLQVTDVSYGIPSQVTNTRLVGIGAAGRMLVPTNDSLDPDPDNEVIEGSWIDPALNTTGGAWTDVVNGVGYWDEATDPNPKPGDGVVLANSQTEFSRTQGGNAWRYGYWNKTDDADGAYVASSADFRQFTWIGTNTITQFNHWDGTKWDLAVAPATPNTEMRNDGAQPAGLNAGGKVHIPIRRWVSEITGGIMIHGNISDLDAAGDGVIARILVDGNEIYRREINGNSTSYRVFAQVTTGQRVDFVIDPGAAGNDVGDNTAYTAVIENVTSQLGGTSGLPTLADDITTDVEARVKGAGTSAYIRIPFTPAVSDFDSLALHVKYQDAFVAYLNGVPIASSNGPGAEAAAWNSVANSERTIANAVEYEVFDVTEALTALNAGGTNYLMIHAMNSSLSDDDLLAAVELVGTKLEVQPEIRRYFTSSTPGEQNGLGAEEVGPLFRDHSHSPAQPQRSQPIVVTANLAQTFSPITTVTLGYKVMYGTITNIPMVDNGTGGDAVAGDGIYSATIPANIAQPGQMIRWFMTAVDSNAHTSRYPAFRSTAANDYVGTTDTEQYFGTVIADPNLTSGLRIIHTFLQTPSGADSDSGARGSVYYNGVFYDNVLFNLHGQSTRGFPKKSYDVDFTSDHRFELSEDVPKMKDFNLLSNYADKAKLRNTLAYKTLELTGSASHLAFPVHIRQNGTFYGVYDFVEDGDDRWLERMGLNPDNSLFKIYNTFFDAGGAERKSGTATGTAELTAFINGLAATGTTLTNYIYDNVDLAGMANFLAGFTLTSNTDCCHKNFYAYRDTHGSGEWSFFPWDNDLTFGRNWGGFGLSYHDYSMYSNNPLNMGGNNNLIQKLYAIPAFAQMYNRRIRTQLDEIMGAPGMSTGILENMVEEWRAKIGVDGPADHTKWGQVATTDIHQQFETWPQAVDRILNEYIAPRRTFLYNTLAEGPVEPAPVKVINGDVGVTTGKYMVPVDDSLGTTWTGKNFNDSSWSSGVTGFGYEDTGSDFAALLRTNVKPTTVNAAATTMITRFTFDASDLNNINKLTLRMKVDDGFVAYINGVEVARNGVTGNVSWNSGATNLLNVVGRTFRNFPITNTGNTLNITPTGNVLAIQVVNQNATSPDMLLVPELYLGTFPVVVSNRQIPAAQPADAAIDVGTVEFNPVSGNQDQEFIELVNNKTYAVDISGWEVKGAVEMTFRPGTVIPAGGRMYITPDAVAFRSRTTGPRGGQGLFVQGGYTGHLSNFGETIEIYNKSNQLVESLTYTGTQTPNQEFLRITEVMYNPAGPSAAELLVNPAFDNDDFEFIELQNTSNSATLDLNQVRFTAGVTFDFTGSAKTSLAPGERTLVVGNLDAFRARYGTGLNALIAGAFTAGTLNNNGEGLKLEDVGNSTIQEFSYSDNTDNGWSSRADGQGSSLQIVDTAGDYGQGTNWRASTEILGSPGAAGVAAINGLVINEILAHTDLPAVDAIELYNPTNSPITVSNFYLSDSAASVTTLGKFSIPTQVVPAGGYLVLDEGDFNASGGVNTNDFRLSSLGDQVYLTLGTATGPTMFLDVADFGATPNGKTLGRYPNGTGALVPMSRVTLGSENGAPQVGPVIISEVNYHPTDPSTAALAIDPTLTASDLEFVEIHNPTTSTVNLQNWRIRGGVDYDFAAAQTLGAGQTLTIISFNPTDPLNAARLNAFRAHYGLAVGVPLVGGYGGQLDDAGERVTLQRPGVPPLEDPTVTPRFIEDEVRFDDVTPWPTNADGAGDSLQRSAPSFFGRSDVSWEGAVPTPGSVAFTGNVLGDFNGDRVVNSHDIDILFDAINANHNVTYYDLNGDSVVNSADANSLIRDVLHSPLGDVNLDGVTDASDFNSWNLNKFGTGNRFYAQGDLSGDGRSDVSDFNIWFANRFTAPAPAAVGSSIPKAALAARGVNRVAAVDSVMCQVSHDSEITTAVDSQSRDSASSNNSTNRPLALTRLVTMEKRSGRLRQTLSHRRASQENAGSQLSESALTDLAFAAF